MTTYNFSLQSGETGPLMTGSRPEELRIPLSGMTPILSVGDQVLSGTKVAVANSPDKGDMHAPLAGTIRAVEPYTMIIEADGRGNAEPQTPCAESGEPLRRWLKAMGVDVTALYRAATLIVNGVPPEPGITVFEPLLRDYRKTLELGLDTAQKIVEPTKMFLVAAKGNRANAFANCTVVHVPPVYPNGLDPLVIKAVTRDEVLPGLRPDNATILSVKDLYFIGRVMETGRPLTETVMTIGGQNHLVRIGTPVGFLAAEAGATVQPGDRVILGGPLRGMAAVNLEQGVDKETTGLTILRPEASLQATDNFCLGCGQCERHCPARIMPGMISRCAEFKQFTRAEAYHIHSCIECGLCGYWCTAGRPLLHYIRLAKYELALLAGARPPAGPDAEELEAQTGGPSC
ncbi:MAG: electron transporter RnfC [Pseudodesulfovibrio sp.]|jgi:electron transport complex protein RnfC|uniref:Electron transport complex protein RnfC n=1 Tax=Pseudodesulfovibrio indicus TaxID=1716143 RepID=A0A126QPA7_9BACT|nr:electron transporter RnfC [Pseudodesulfovibrio indicus]AMK11596.1 electron transporter RnfC [Pseudodesulfovibrio indicus]TDT90003.1 electron transport complex protein RnfC [Pseudodesulfovibrio indicus]